MGEVPIREPPPELHHADSADDRYPAALEDPERDQLQAQLQGANEHIAVLQTQLTEKDHNILLLQQQLHDVCKFQRKLTLDAFAEDRVADLLNKELKLSRVRSSKLSEELLLACHALQDSHSRITDLSADLARAHEVAAKTQRQVTALKKLVVSKVTYRHSGSTD